MADEAPRVSVVVPVRDRRDLLSAMLDALSAQSFRDFEVVVVDDGSRDGSADEAERPRMDGPRVRVLRQPPSGAVAARRVGVEAARGDVIAFTDSDCEPDPHWLERCVAAIDGGADLVHGTTEPARAVAPLERSMWSGTEGLFPSCNLVVRRTAYDRAGGFDPSAVETLGFRIGGRARGLGFGEDTLLGWRIRRAGRAEHVADAVVRHHVFPPDFADSLSRCWMAAAFPALVREVPELRRTLLRHRLFLGPRPRLPVYLLVLASIARRRQVAAVALAWWISRHLAEHGDAPWSQRVRAVPALLALDTVTVLALVTGSLRARTIML